MLVPDGHDLLVERLVEWEAVGIGMDNAFEALRVDLRLDVRIRVPHEVVVQFDAARLLLVDDNLTHLQEEVADLRVVVVELGSAIGRSRGLVGLDDH